MSSKSGAPVIGVDCDVLEHRAEALRHRENLGLRFRIELCGLGVAAAFEVEDAVVLQPCSSSPIRARCGSVESVVLPVPDRPKNSAVLPSAPILAEQCMGRMPLIRRVVVEQREHRLLDLAGIGGAADQDDVARHVERDHHLGPRAVAGRIGLEARQVQDGRVGGEVGAAAGTSSCRMNSACQAVSVNTSTEKIGARRCRH
jgi:hypothetical protein